MVYILTPSQKQIVLDRHRFRVVNCGRRFGKSTLAILEIIGKAVSKNDCRVAYIANTYQQARDIAWRELKSIARPVTISINESRLEVEIKTQDGGIGLIWLRGWESIETLRGQRFDFVVLDEVAQMRNFWENWQEVIRPTLTDTRGEALFLSTPKGYNHFYDLYELHKTDTDYASFHFKTEDNPQIPREEIEKAKKELTQDRFAQEYEADFRKVEGIVYPEFSRDRHITDVVPQFRTERMLGVDFGYTNPSAVYTIDLDKEGIYWITQEYYKTGKVNIEVIEYVKSQFPNVVYPDPAEPDRIEEMRRHDINVRDVSKDIEAGINKVRELLKAGKVKIHSSCINLISELETYHYPDRKDGLNQKELPVKEDDHAVDAIRYALFMHSPGDSGGITSSYPSWTTGEGTIGGGMTSNIPNWP